MHVTTLHLSFLNTGSEDGSQIAILTRQALYQPNSLPSPTHSLAFSRLSWDQVSLSEEEFSPLKQPETNSSQGFLSYGPDTSCFPPPTLLSAHRCETTGGRQRRMRLCGIPLWPSPPLRSLSGILSGSHLHWPSDHIFPLLVLLSPTVARLSARFPWFQPPACIFPSHLLTDGTSRNALELLPLGLLRAPALQLSSLSAAQSGDNFRRHISVDVFPGSSC